MTWRSHERKPPNSKDALHVETHVLEKRDFFITDASPCSRCAAGCATSTEIPVEAMNVGDYLSRRKSSGPGGEPNA